MKLIHVIQLHLYALTGLFKSDLSSTWNLYGDKASSSLASLLLRCSLECATHSSTASITATAAPSRPRNTWPLYLRSPGQWSSPMDRNVSLTKVQSARPARTGP
uniref:Uncharacterized protein n=1 Tax=Arundo donax TaxID=35708 RepID=A0A0A9FAY1_ARUDO